MFGFGKNTQILDESSILWMIDSFDWALRHFNAPLFFTQTQLVTPTNACFPDKGENPEQMAQLILRRVIHYAGLEHWPFRLMDEDAFANLDVPAKALSYAARGQAVPATEVVAEADKLPIIYHPAALGDPQVVIANFAHSLAHYLGTTANEPPPGGVENWPQVTELLAVFLGFGLMMANSAYTAKIRSCASCAGPAIERTNYLSQYDITYALALFSRLKEIDNNSVLPHLKASLRSFYKKAYKDVSRRDDELQKLKLMAVAT